MSVPMQWFTFPIPALLDPFALTPDRIAAYFTGKGYTVTDGAAIDAVNRHVTIGLDRDPSADVAAFANNPTPAEQLTAAAVTTLRAYLVAVRAIAPASRTPEQRAILAISVLVHDLAQAAS